MSTTTYNDDAIQTLEWHEHIRRRSGMYIGRRGNGERQGDGIYVLLKEVVDNSIDEFSQGFGKRIDILIENDRTVSVRDFGRGIPLGKVVDAVSKLNTGGKFDTANFQKSVGMNGVGTKAVNAMSSDFYVASYRDGQVSFAHFSRGQLLESGLDQTKEKNGTFIRFTPDEQMFEGYAFHMEIVESMIKNYSYLKKGLTLVLNGTPYRSENGLLDLVTENMSETPLYPLIHLEGEDIEIVLTHGNSYGENISSFVNGQNTRDGGTHLAAYREAIAKTFKDFFKKDYKPEDVRQGVVGAIAIQIQEPIFEGQTKTKLGSTYMWETEVKGPDGATHQGVFDVSFLSSVPGMVIYSPASYKELETAIRNAAAYNGFCAVRYPRGCEGDMPDLDVSGDFTVLEGGKKAIVTYGRLFSEAYAAKQRDPAVTVIKLNRIYPLPEGFADRLSAYQEIHFFEEGIQSGGIGEHLAAALSENGYRGVYQIHAIADRFVPCSTVKEALRDLELDQDSMLKAVGS